MFCHQPDLAGQVEGHQHWLNVEDLDALYATHLARGATIVSPLEDKPWGKREYTVRDLNGYHLRFAGEPTYQSKGDGVFPEGVRIVRRMPMAEEFRTIAGAEFYASGVPAGILERTHQGFVATAPDGEVIGTTRVMCDAPGWYSIWDVAVRPDWQGRRIGTALVQDAIDFVREESPGAWLYLFTTKHGFYERLGFGTESVTLMRV